MYTTEEIATRAADPSYKMSGAAYVRANTRVDPLVVATRIPIVEPHNCDHCATICHTVSCVESWRADWVLYFDRTGGGRRLAAMLDVPVSPGRPRSSARQAS